MREKGAGLLIRSERQYLLDVTPTNVHATLVEPVLARTGEPLSLEKLANALPSHRYRTVTWREGTSQPLCSRFARVRVRLAKPDAQEPEEQTLLLEWPWGEEKPTHYTLSNLPTSMRLRELVRLTKQRWRTEQAYQQMKSELGLDHFEGRTYPGWQHHVSAVLACYAFLVTALRQSFPPSAQRTRRHNTLPCSTRASRRRLAPYRAARSGAGPHRLATPLPGLSSDDVSETSVSPARHETP